VKLLHASLRVKTNALNGDTENVFTKMLNGAAADGGITGNVAASAGKAVSVVGGALSAVFTASTAALKGGSDAAQSSRPPFPSAALVARTLQVSDNCFAHSDARTLFYFQILSHVLVARTLHVNDTLRFPLFRSLFISFLSRFIQLHMYPLTRTRTLLTDFSIALQVMGALPLSRAERQSRVGGDDADTDSGGGGGGEAVLNTNAGAEEYVPTTFLCECLRTGDGSGASIVGTGSLVSRPPVISGDPAAAAAAAAAKAAAMTAPPTVRLEPITYVKTTFAEIRFIT
jgi:hypothetical protein